VGAILVPVFVELLLTFSVFFSDSYFLSRISDEAAAGVGTVIPLFMVCVLVFMMMAQGASNLAGQFLGGGQDDQRARTYCAALVINVLLGAGASLTLGLGADRIAATLGLEGGAKGYAADFMLYIAPALFLIGVKYALACAFVSQGKTVWNMFGGLIAIAANIALNVMFARMQMGLFGVALATILAQAAVIAFYLTIVTAALRVRYDWPAFLRRPGAPLYGVLRLGVPSAIQPVSSEIAMLVVATAAVRLGVEAMAARMYVMNLVTVAICWAAAVSIANQVQIAILVGARRPEAADAVFRRNLGIAMVGSLAIAMLARLFASSLLGVFTRDPRVLDIGVGLLTVGILWEAARSFSKLSSFALKAAGDASFPAMVGVGVTWLVGVPLALSLCLFSGLGMTGLWIGLVVDEGLRGAINYLRWHSGAWNAAPAIAWSAEPSVDGH
jgi:putative MATE family efflux protein